MGVQHRARVMLAARGAERAGEDDARLAVDQRQEVGNYANTGDYTDEDDADLLNDVVNPDDARHSAPIAHVAGATGHERMRAPSARAPAPRRAPHTGDSAGELTQYGELLAAETIGAAKQCLLALVQHQVQVARDERVRMNEPALGDSHIRLLMPTMLPPNAIRSVFLRVAERPTAWPRIRPLFGPPPYHFLRPEDAGCLNAGGLASCRSNMTYADRRKQTASYTQFGFGHLVDAHGRHFNLLPNTPEPGDSDLLPHMQNAIAAASRLMLCVRIKKHRRNVKRAMLSNATLRRGVLLPTVSELLQLRYSEQLKRIYGTQQSMLDFSMLVRVTRVVRRSAHSSTATIAGVRT